MNPKDIAGRVHPKPIFKCVFKTGIYPTKEAAKAALVEIMLSPTRSRREYPRSYYYCDLHEAWHLSHHPPGYWRS